jgi:adenosylcobalamin-dependent ribonucleoside-triphosphate reductase
MLSFELKKEVVDSVADRLVPWGFESGPGLTVGELTFVRTYSAKKEDESKERWHETAKRVVEGSFSIQKDHVINHLNATWDEERAQRSAAEMLKRMLKFKFWAPGRGLENMGTKGVNEWGYADRLYNCAFVSTLDKRNPTRPYASLMSKSMRGVGVGFDTLGRGSHTLVPPKGRFHYPIPDTTEGWVDSTESLLKAYFHGLSKPHFAYDRIRPKGAAIDSGGLAPGAGPLEELHVHLDRYLGDLVSDGPAQVHSRQIVDIANLLGKAVVSGGKRRTALLALGYATDTDYANLKNPTLPENKERMGPNGWGWASNNSLKVTSYDDIDFNDYAEQQIHREPGLFLSDLVQNYGRMADGYQPGIDKAIGTNPCGEISLEDGETCNLVSINLMAQESKWDFLETIKYAYLYAKSVTLMATSWQDTNYVSMRNRRIGCSVSGVAEFVETYGWTRLREWLDDGYKKIREWDQVYSAWLCVRESVKVTTVKPEGTAALLSGSTPGVHYPVARNYIRRIQFSINDPLLDVLDDAGYHIEPYVGNPDYTMVVEFPTMGSQIRDEQEVSIYEKVGLAAMLQDVWSDNQVSFTATFDKERPDQLAAALRMNWGKYKSISCAPIYEVEDADEAREMQLPYQGISLEQYHELIKDLKPVDMELVYNSGQEAIGDRYCDTDKCVIA